MKDTNVFPDDIVVFVTVIVFDVARLRFMRYAENRSSVPLVSTGPQSHNPHPTFEETFRVFGCCWCGCCSCGFCFLVFCFVTAFFTFFLHVRFCNIEINYNFLLYFSSCFVFLCFVLWRLFSHFFYMSVFATLSFTTTFCCIFQVVTSPRHCPCHRSHSQRSGRHHWGLGPRPRHTSSGSNDNSRYLHRSSFFGRIISRTNFGRLKLFIDSSHCRFGFEVPRLVRNVIYNVFVFFF